MSDPNNNNDSEGPGAVKNQMRSKMAEMMNHSDDLSKGDAIKILSDHLEGHWDNLSQDDLDMKILQGGFVNRLYLCTNKKSGQKVILRLMGGKLVDKYAKESIINTHGEVVESLNYVLMDQNNLGPKIFGVFSGGRIEEYIQSRTLSDDDVLCPDFMSAFARKLARVHHMRPPIVKKAKDMFGIINKIKGDNLDGFINKMKQVEVPKQLEPSAKLWFEFDMYKYLDWMFDTFPSIRTRVVFCHNDMNRLNCIIREGPGTELMAAMDKLVLIDYEFCSFAWRGCDIGQHFFQRTVDVSKMVGREDQELDYHSKLAYPSEDERRFFIEQYLDEVKVLGTYQLDPVLDSVETILIESEYFGILWNLFLLFWMIRDHEKFTETGFGDLGQMFGWFGDIVRTLNDRKERFLDLKQKYPSN